MPPDPANPEINLRFREGEMQVLELAALANITWQPGPGFDNPVLLLAGGEDVVVPPANQLKLVSSVPGETCWLLLWCVPAQPAVGGSAHVPVGARGYFSYRTSLLGACVTLSYEEK